MRRLVVNDARNQLGEHTFWDDLCEWLNAEFVGSDYSTLAEFAESYIKLERAPLLVRNATFFPPINTNVPTISLLQDIVPDGPLRSMQEAVIKSSRAVVFNSEFTRSKYHDVGKSGTPGESVIVYQEHNRRTIPLPVDFSLFEPQNAMGCQQALSLPDGCVCWIGASQGAAGQIKGFDIMMQVARLNPDINFVCVFKDAAPAYPPPNMRCYERLTHVELVKVIGACRVGLCTSRMESQHLAGIEMGACGLPMVAPPVGVYWKREGMVGVIVEDPSPDRYTTAIRTFLHHGTPADSDFIRSHWRRTFDKPVIRAQWEKLVQEVECSGRS